MATTAEGRTPVHLWIVGGLATLWNGYGCYGYLMARMRNTDFLANAMPEVDPNAYLAWIEAFPIWAQIGWGMGVWLGLLGSVLLLAKSRWAIWSFALSLVGAILSLGYQIAMAPALAGAEGPKHQIIPLVIILIAAGLLYYAWRQRERGVLR
ncbi:MAG TPA: hypothetical protein VM308_06745 [Sphingomicrobium sp.]|nr:hypothetical protein [Sphingomicrobium sp.]